MAAKLLGRDDAACCERFVREQALRVRHRHVVQPTGWAAEDDLVSSRWTWSAAAVEQLLARHGPLPDGYVRVVLEQVLEALVAVHAAGLVHRDVKPGNLPSSPPAPGARGPPGRLRHRRIGDPG